ncbi:hypothetical protein [Peribacillus frigoritolerans]|uniref:hypothetical protein n=1 Tax=Peribacillus frigoritolerans TaxID=450367 RepID=UPI0038079870
MTNWFLINSFPSLPILSLIVISNPQTIIRTAPENRKLHYKVIHRDALTAKINQMEHSITEPSFSEKHLKKAVRVMNKHHIHALRDYFYLIGSTITNRQLTVFLSISSSSSATRILQLLNLTSSGVNKGRVYRLNFDE